MEIKRYLASAAVAMMVVGALGMAGSHVFAQSSRPAPAAQVRSLQAPTVEPTEAATPGGTDTDQVQSQVGDLLGEIVGAADTTGGQTSPGYTGSITVTETATGQQNETDEAVALASQAKIRVDQAKAAALAANAGTTVVKASLDNENGVLVYSVELSNGADVKVDADNGQILSTDTASATDSSAGSQVQQP